MNVKTLADSTGEWEAIISDLLATSQDDTQAILASLDGHDDFMAGLLVDYSKKWRGKRRKGIIKPTVTNKPFFRR